MAIQYISDNSGNHTAVIIPINEWNNIIAMHEDLKELERPVVTVSKRKPSDFKGSLPKDIALKMLSDLELSRNDWERDF